MTTEKPPIPTLEELTTTLEGAKSSFDNFLEAQRWSAAHRDQSEDREWREHVFKQFQDLIKAQEASMRLVGFLTLIAAAQAEELAKVSKDSKDTKDTSVPAKPFYERLGWIADPTKLWAIYQLLEKLFHP